MGLILVTAPAAEPVHLAELKAHCRVETSDDDAALAAYLREAREQLEATAGIQLVTATWRQTAWGFPDSEDDYAFRLERSPVVAVSSVQYLDTAGVLQTLAASQYELDTSATIARLRPAYGVSWPGTQENWQAVRVTFVAGYSTPFTVNATTNVVTANGRTLTTGEKVRLANSGGVLPDPLALLTDYHVVGASGSTGQLSLTAGGGAVDVTNSGSGTHFLGEVPERARSLVKLLAAQRYEDREGTGKEPLAERTLWMSLWPGGY